MPSAPHGGGAKPHKAIPDNALRMEAYLRDLDSEVRSPPADFDLRGPVDVVYDQFQYNSCVANAVCGALQYAWQHYTSQKSSISPSRMMLYWGERKAENLVRYNAPGYIGECLDFYLNYGACDESIWRYGTDAQFLYNGTKNIDGDSLEIFASECPAVDIPHSLENSHGKIVKVTNHYFEVEFFDITVDSLTLTKHGKRVLRGDNGILTRLKQTLVTGFPIIMTFQNYVARRKEDSVDLQLDAPGNISSLGVLKHPPIWLRDRDVSWERRWGHCMLIVGYEGGNFLVRNSWGSDWGQDSNKPDGDDSWGSREFKSDYTWGQRRPRSEIIQGHFWLPEVWLQYTKIIDGLVVVKPI